MARISTYDSRRFPSSSGAQIQTESAQPSWSLLSQEAGRIVEVGERRGLALRVLGSVGIYMRSGRPQLYEAIGRSAPKDIDLISTSNGGRGIVSLFEQFGYDSDQDMAWSSEGRRYAFTGRAYDGTPTEVDVFVDELRMCHTLKLRDRIAVHPITVSLADLLLQKLQIVRLTFADRQDVGLLLAEHTFENEGEDGIDLTYIGDLLADHWGFWRTAVGNLQSFATKLDDLAFEAGDRAVIDSRIAELLAAIEAAPKTRRWKLRAKIGERKKWYEEVEEDRAALM